MPDRGPLEAQAALEEARRILRSRIDLSGLPRLCRDVTERVIIASGDFDYFTDLVCDEESLAAGVDALAAGAPVIADSAMVTVGITGCEVISKIGEPLTARLARTASISRSAAAVRLAFGEVGPGAVWVAGGTFEELAEIIARRVEPAFVVGLPVGFVGAAEAKDALRASGAPAVSNVSEKGGAEVAVAALEAMLARSQVAGPGQAGQDAQRAAGSPDAAERGTAAGGR